MCYATAGRQCESGPSTMGKPWVRAIRRHDLRESRGPNKLLHDNKFSKPSTQFQQIKSPLPLLPLAHPPTEMSSASTSTTSLVSNTTVSSRAPLNGSTTVQPAPKDFQSAFASLQSTYGFSGTAPTPVSKKSSAPSSTTSPAADASRAPTKDFQSAFADLQSTYGFGGAAPTPIPKQKKDGTSSRSLFSKFRRSSSSPKSQGNFTSPSTSSKTKVRAIPRPTQHIIVL
ncbi:hypothetical protein B0H13DRAFT_901680 [Mycena leptocephala]|nr:hypothetical protein B0H13DRAFT_901680 [Mycena leptocephala]